MNRQGDASRWVDRLHQRLVRRAVTIPEITKYVALGGTSLLTAGEYSVGLPVVTKWSVRTLPEFTSPFSPAESMGRLEEYLRDGTHTGLPQSLRDLRVARFALEARNGNSLTIRFAHAAPSRLVRYCGCHAEPAPGGSVVRYHLRSPWRPRTAGLLVLALLCVQMVYELFAGTFDRVTVIIAVVVPSVTALLAELDNRTIRTKYRAGVLDALHMALDMMPDNSKQSPGDR